MKYNVPARKRQSLRRRAIPGPPHACTRKRGWPSRLEGHPHAEAIAPPQRIEVDRIRSADQASRERRMAIEQIADARVDVEVLEPEPLQIVRTGEVRDEVAADIRIGRAVRERRVVAGIVRAKLRVLLVEP